MLNALLEQHIATLRNTSGRLVELTDGISERALDFRAHADDWTIREILAHLVDDEMYVMRLRLARIVKEQDPQLAPNDEKAWYATRNTSRDQLAELLADFSLQRAASLGIIAFLTEDQWARGGIQPEYGHFTAAEWLGYWAEHDMTHLEQIENNLTATERE